MRNIALATLTLIAVLGLAAEAWSGEKLPNQAEPIKNLIVAGQPSIEQFKELSKEGFTTVINLRLEGEFDEFDEEAVVEDLGMDYVHIPVKNITSITDSDAEALHEAVSSAKGGVLLHCTVGWRASGLFAIERFLNHDVSPGEAYRLAVAAHMAHAADDVKKWIGNNDPE